MSNRSKGTQREGQCLQQLKQLLDSRHGYKYIASWRSIAHKFQNTDLLGAFDLCLAYDYSIASIVKGKIQVWFCVQCKSRFEKAYYEEMKHQWQDAPAHCYLAVWHPRQSLLEKHSGKENLRLKDFLLIRL